MRLITVKQVSYSALKDLFSYIEERGNGAEVDVENVRFLEDLGRRHPRYDVKLRVSRECVCPNFLDFDTFSGLLEIIGVNGNGHAEPSRICNE